MPGTSIGEIGLDLVVNKNDFEKSMSGIQKTAKKAALSLAAAFSVKKIVDFGKSCLELGSNLAEVQNVVDVTFPSMSAKVDEFAKSAASGFGLSETMAKKFTGTFGAMAKAFGFSEQAAYDMGSALTGLAGDVASFYNITQDEAYTKLKSVFTGETESLKDLGVVMTQSALDAYALANGFGKTTQQMSEAEKVALRYQFVQNQLAAAQGDFARTSGSWANQVRILKLQFDSLKATIGQGLINLFTPVIRVVNTLIGKLATLANAFKSFTELITGKKSSGASQISGMGDAAAEAGESMDSASESAGNMADSNNKIAQSAKRAAKEMRSLMGFDQINKISEPEEDSGGDTGTGGGNTGSGAALGAAVDFGNLVQGETVLDSTDKKMSALIKRCKELAAIFKNGFKIGFGDSEKKIKSITKSLKNIEKTAKSVFASPEVVNAADRWAETVMLSLGKIVGSVLGTGITIADNLIGGFDRFLARSKNYIKQRIVSLFNVTGDIANLAGNFGVAFQEIFNVFSGDTAKGITADIIGIFSDGFLGGMDLGLRIVRDKFQLIVQPITENADKIKEAILNTLEPIETGLDTLYNAVNHTFGKIFEMYDSHIKPLVNSVASGISYLVGLALDVYNNTIAPVMQSLAEKFDTVWQEHIQPTIDKAVVLIGNIADLTKALWENILQPFIEWLIENILPVVGPILEMVGGDFLNLLSVVGDVIGGALDILNGFTEFLVGAFTGDNEKAWSGIEKIMNTFKSAAETVMKFVKNSILKPFSNFLKNTFGINVEDVFKGIVKFLRGDFLRDWRSAWSKIKDTFKNIFSGLADLAKTPLNAIIGAFNGVIETLNGVISKINSIRFKITVPDWVPGIGGAWWGFDGFNINPVGTVPYLANGAFVKKNTPQLAMIGDNLHQGEFVAPEDKLKKMAMEAVRLAGGNGVTKEELEYIINQAVMRIVSALNELGFYIDSERVSSAMRMAAEQKDYRHNPVIAR